MSQTLNPSHTPLWDDAMTASGDARGHRGKPDWSDIVFFLLLSAGAVYALITYNSAMDYYEQMILGGAVLGFSWMAWLWRPLRTVMVLSGLTALFAIWLYSDGQGLAYGDIARADTVFFLKYLFSSQSAILWMCALFVLATVTYWIGMFSTTAAWLGTVLTWGASMPA